MSFDPQIRAHWQATSAWLRELGYGGPAAGVEGSNNDPRPVLFRHIVPMGHWQPGSRSISRQEVRARLLKLVQPGFLSRVFRL
jgi:hypothetical protein